MSMNRILVINPRTNFTKIAVYDNTKVIFLNKIFHSDEELEKFKSFAEQHEYRKNIILEELKHADITLSQIKAVVGRGGLVKPLKSGVYEVNEKMLKDLNNSDLGEDSVNLGGIIASDIAKTIPGVRAFIANPVVVDEMDDIAKISGHPDFERKSVFHALNQKAVARKYSKTVMKKYIDLNLIVVHIGSGVSVGAHKKGKVVDVNQALDGEGPFSAKRSGTLPVGDIVRMCFSGKFNEEQVLDKIRNHGGMFAYFGTEDVYKIEQMVMKGDKKAELVYSAMAYQLSKSIGAMYTVFEEDIDAILITGGIANSKWFVNKVIERVKKIAIVHVYPGGDEMEALAMNVLGVLRNEFKPIEYK